MNSSTWILYSGATSHMVKEKKNFTELDKEIRTSIKVVSGEVLLSAGKGNIIVGTESDQRTITDVLFVPRIDRNLLSVRQLLKSGYKVLFDEDKGIIMDNNYNKISEALMIGTSFPLSWPIIEKAYGTQEENISDLWHKRYGHAEYIHLQVLQENNMVKGLPKFTVTKEICEGCVRGKHHRESFPNKSETRAVEKLQLIHTDVCGPMQTESIKGSKYILT